MLHTLVEPSHDRRATQQLVSCLDERATCKIGSEKTQHRQPDQRHNQAESRNGKGQIAFRQVKRRNERLHPSIDEADEPPNERRGDRQRSGDNDAGQKISPQARHRTGWRIL